MRMVWIMDGNEALACLAAEGYLGERMLVHDWPAGELPVADAERRLLVELIDAPLAATRMAAKQALEGLAPLPADRVLQIRGKA